MKDKPIPRVKICCISSIEEAMLAIQAGASALGLVGHMPSGPGIISDELIATIAASVPPPVDTFLLTSETTTDGIIRHHQRVRTRTIQLVDTLKEGRYQDLRHALPGVKIVQVIHVSDDLSLQQAIDISTEVDAILLDSGNPHKKVQELGGTGRIHDWNISRRIVQSLEVPVFLAGGLHAGNVSEALEQVSPFGVDICSGVRTNGKLDIQKMDRLFARIFDRLP